MADVFLPKTDFAIRANAAETEPHLRQTWQNLYRDRLAMGGEPYVLHDGPPYANGDIHIGHALNKVLKDFVLRTRFLLGNSTAYTPGWDCHGLPIEWKVEQEWRKADRDKNADKEAFRRDCREYARGWVNTQMGQFHRLGVLADWDNPYLTMDFSTEAKIVETFHEMVAKGLVYSARKPVLWSPVEQTALAEAETDDGEHEVPAAWVLFPITDGPLAGAKALLWTTTPWSLPGNRAVAYNPHLAYALFEVNKGEQILMAEEVGEQMGATYVRGVDAGELQTTSAQSPLTQLTVPFLPATYVDAGKGSGLVHVGPASSVDDWRLFKDAGFEADDVPNFIGPDGRYLDCAGMPHSLVGVSVVKNKRLGGANDHVLDILRRMNLLFRVDKQTMTLKHSWRSGALLFENATPQWFIDVSGVTYTMATEVSFIPEQSRNRFLSMLQGRTDWLVSRQRQWGTPLAIFAKPDGTVLTDPAVLKRTHDLIEREGADAWFTLNDYGKLLGEHSRDGWEPVGDVLDVWFDSGCVHAFSNTKDADLYLEGSDQHRGWFQSSFLVSQLTQGKAPYKTVLTHGFTLDPNGRKMSKSEMNGVDPMMLVDKYGADVVRLWVASIDYVNDVRVGPKTFDAVSEVYKKLRNTLRYLLGALNGSEPEPFTPKSGVVFAPENLAIKKLVTVSETCREAALAYDFTRYLTTLHEYCTHDLSAALFDVRKDSLYCDGEFWPVRQHYLSALDLIFRTVTPLLAPILPYLAEEAWRARYDGSVHLERWPDLTAGKPDTATIEEHLAQVEAFKPLLEEARKEGRIKSNADAIITGDAKGYAHFLRTLSLTSGVVQSREPLTVLNAVEQGWVKCDRCRLYYEKLEAEHCWRCERAKADPKTWLPEKTEQK